SCQAARMAGRTDSGVYTLDVDGTVFETVCDQTSSGGGWTHVATVTNFMDQLNLGIWRPNAPNNLWESMQSAQIGGANPNLNRDFRSPAFHLVRGNDVRITWGIENDGNARFLLSAASCLGNNSLAGHFASLDWDCTANQPLADCGHPCPITDQSPKGGELVLLNGSNKNSLFFKAGEADGQDGTGRERVYLSSGGRSNLDDIGGLGAWCDGTSCNPQGTADVSEDSGGVTVAPGDQYWVIWVR